MQRAFGLVLALGVAMAPPLAARDLPTIPFGPPEDTITAWFDPLIAPHYDAVQSALGDYRIVEVTADFAAPGMLAAARDRLATVLAAADAEVMAAVRAKGRHQSEWLGLTLNAADIALGVEATAERAELAVAIERQLAANAFVFGTYFQGTEVSGVLGAFGLVRGEAVEWALTAAGRARAAGDSALADQLADRAFQWAQTLSQGAAARAMVRMMRDPELVADLDDLAERMRAVSLLTAYFGPDETAGAVAPDLHADLQENRARIEGELTALRDAGVDLAATLLPRPLSLSETQALLAPDEALIIIVPGATRYSVMAVSADQSVGYQSAGYSVDLDEEVARLLGGIGAWSTRSAVPLSDLGEAPVPGLGHSAWRLYEEFLAPAAQVTAGKPRLLIVATGTAAHFPWQMLVTAEPGPGETFAQLRWLVRDHALVALPAVEALAAPRLGRGTGGLSYLGVGAPDYAAGRGGWVESSRGRVVLGLTPLPEAADEVRRVAALYPAGNVALTGVAASELRLQEMASDGRLQRFDVLHFATHGLIWGDHPDVYEGMLALSTDLPESLRGQWTRVADLTVDVADGALEEAEIRRLRLNAALVILSACKTATGLPHERDGVTGLAAAFLHAGAERVLATHWPVNSDAAVSIVTTMMAADPAMDDPAEALRAAMLAEIARGGRRADPSWWAPFTLIGAP